MSLKKWSYWIVVTLGLFAHQLMASPNVNFSLSGDLVYDQGLNDESSAEEKFKIRSAEFIAYGAIDQTWDGVLTMVSHDLGGENIFEVHEIYVESTKLIPRSRLKIGQYFLGVGRLNRFHRHEWAFTEAPLVHEEFLSDEALFDTGAELGVLLPTSFLLDWTFGVTSGTTLGHGHEEGHGHDGDEEEEEEEHDENHPIFYTRLATFFDWGNNSGAELGTSFLRRKDEGADVSLVGLDFTAKKRFGSRIETLFQAELWYQNEKEESSDEQFGFYLFVDKSLTERLFIGFRADYFDLLSYKNEDDEKVSHRDYAFTTQLTHKNSEFFQTRLSVTHSWEEIAGSTAEKDTRALFQLVFFLGAHPTHNF